jgi:hypothetical protein
MSENKNYSQKHVLYNPTIGSMVLLIIVVAFIFLMLKNESARKLSIQFAEKVIQLISK